MATFVELNKLKDVRTHTHTQSAYLNHTLSYSHSISLRNTHTLSLSLKLTNTQMETSLVPSSFFDCFEIHIFIFFFITTFFFIEDIFINIFLSPFSATAKDFVSKNSFT